MIISPGVCWGYFNHESYGIFGKDHQNSELNVYKEYMLIAMTNGIKVLIAAVKVINVMYLFLA